MIAERDRALGRGENVAGGATSRLRDRPLIAHVIFNLDLGGMERGLVNLVNEIPPERYRHAIVCLRGFTEFRNRIRHDDVEVLALGKREGIDLRLYARLFRALRRLRPDIVHTRNLAALEGQLVAAAAGVPGRVHGEHGRDVYDLHGTNRKYNLLRKAIRPAVGQYITVSKDLEGWLVETIGVPRARVTQIYNGVDSVRFRPRGDRGRAVGPEGFLPDDAFLVGSVGRMAAVKDYPTLIRAFLALLAREPELRTRLRLVIAGDGEAREECLALLRAASAEGLAWLPGSRSDTAEILSAMDLFVLPSLGEGISNTILEAMASGRPVVATSVGGNLELVEPRRTGVLVPPGDAGALAEAIRAYLLDPAMRLEHGRAARAKVETRFSMKAMVDGYLRVYDSVLGEAGGRRAGAAGEGSGEARA